MIVFRNKYEEANFTDSKFVGRVTDNQKYVYDDKR